MYPKREVTPGAVVLDVEHVSAAKSGVNDVSLQVREGEIVGLAGLVGAGRTELARVLFGLTPADAGTIRWRGKPVSIDSPSGAVELGIAYVPEDRRRNGVVMEMPVAANITLATLRQIARGGLIDFGKENAHGDGVRGAAEDTDTVGGRTGRESVGRQSAKGRAGTVAGGGAAIDHSR